MTILFLTILSRLINTLPRAWALALGRLLGLTIFILWPYRRNVAHGNLEKAFPDWSEKKRKTVLKKTYQHFGQVIMDFIRIPHITEAGLSKVLTIDERFIKSLKEKRQGAIIMSGHVGGWEMIPLALGRLGYQAVLMVMPQRGKGAPFIDAIRSSTGSGAIAKRASIRQMIRLLNEGTLLGLAGDQDARRNGIWVDFFGQPSSRPRGGAVFALHSKVPMLFAACILGEDKRYHLHFTPLPTDDCTGDKDKDAQLLTQRYNTALESLVRQYPEQYFWFHRMWKSRPPLS